MDTLQTIYKSGYWISVALGICALFSIVPVWLPITVIIISFVLHGQFNIKSRDESKQYQNALYERYAPELKRDFVVDSADILRRIDSFSESYPNCTAAFRNRLNALQEFYRNRKNEPLPSSLTHALLCDFEFIGKYSNIEHPESIATARAMLNRTDNIEQWLNVTRTEITQDEMDAAVESMQNDKV